MEGPSWILAYILKCHLDQLWGDISTDGQRKEVSPRIRGEAMSNFASCSNAWGIDFGSNLYQEPIWDASKRLGCLQQYADAKIGCNTSCQVSELLVLSVLLTSVRCLSFGIWQMSWNNQFKMFQQFSFGIFYSWLPLWKRSVVKGTKKSYTIPGFIITVAFSQEDVWHGKLLTFNPRSPGFLSHLNSSLVSFFTY